MASTSDNLYVTFVDADRDLLKVWGQRNRVSATYIEKQLLHLIPEFQKTQCPNPSRIRKGMFCFAKYTDDIYYRARVISNVQGDCVGVLFVDYGNKDFINISNIRIQEGREGDVLAKMSEQAEEYYLARVVAPLGGWTKEIVSEIRRDICCDEFVSRIVDQVGDQKVLEIQFRNQGFSDYLIKKQFARLISLGAQKQLILSYCSLVPNEQNLNNIFRDMPELNFQKPLPGVPNPGGVKPPQSLNMMSEQHETYNYGKQSNPVNFSQPPPSIPAHYASSRHMNSMMQNPPKMVPQRTFYPSPNMPNIPNIPNMQNIPNNPILRNENQIQPMNPQFNPMPNTQFNAPYQMKANPDMPLLNNVVIEALAHQIKQYITEDNAKSGSEVEKIPHHYVNSVLEVGSTHNVFISNIDDGPWSFSIQLLSSESELNKLMEELASIELIPVKPPLILGHPCIGASAVYENLCRGVIVSISHSAVKVYFVDFGSTEDLPVTSIFELPPKFFKTRVLSQKFSLSGLQKVSYSDDIKRCFREVVQDELLMLRVTSLEGDNLPTCELYHKDRNIKRLLNEKIRDLKTSQDEFPKVGDTVDVVVTWVESPQKFFLQLRSKDAELSALKKELANAPRNCQPLSYQELCVGLRCICQYLSDEQWYRAVITSLKSENAITVFYIDYGNMETVNLSLLRKMDSYGLVAQMGIQAIQCALKGFENKPVDQALSNHLESLILEKDLKMKVVSMDKNCYTVELYDNDEDIGSTLVAYSQKLSMSQNKENVSGWKDIGDSNRQIPSKNEQKSRFSGGGDSPEKKDKSFRGETDRPKFPREKNFRGRSDPEVDWFQSTHTQTNKRFEDKREEQWKSNDRTSKQDKENNWVDKRMFGGYNGDRSYDNRNRDRLSKGTEEWLGLKNNDSADSPDWRNKKKFDENRKPKKKFDDNKGGSGFRDNRQSDFGRRKKLSHDKYGSGSERISNDVKNVKFPLKTDDLCPPDSKFLIRGYNLGHRLNAVVSYFESPGKFFIHDLSGAEEFKKLMDDIQVYYKNKYPSREPVMLDDIVIAEFSDDKVLYRAEVIKTTPTTVQYIDYGNIEIVEEKQTWPVAKQFLPLPSQAIQCRLANVKPVGDEWPKSKSELAKYFEHNEYKVKIVDVADGVYSIVMVNTETGKSVADELVATGFALPDIKEKFVPVEHVEFSVLPTQILKLHISHVESSSKFYTILSPPSVRSLEMEIKNYVEDEEENLNPMDERLLQPGRKCLSTDDDVLWYRGTITEVIDNRVILKFIDRGDSVNVASNKVINIPEYIQKVRPQAFECCLEGMAGKLSPTEEEEFKNAVEQKYYFVHIKSVIDERLSVILYNLCGTKIRAQRSHESPLTIDPIPHVPILGQETSVELAHIESPDEVYIQRTLYWEELAGMTNQLVDFYGDINEEEESESESNIPVGSLVVVRSYKFGGWFRGRITKCKPDQGYDVFFFDYGYKERVPAPLVRRLDPSFYESPMFAVKVSLPVKYDANLKKKLAKKISKIFGEQHVWGFFKREDDILYADFIINAKLLRDEWKKMDGIMPMSHLFKDIIDDKNPLLFQPVVLAKPSTISKNVFVSHIDSPKQFFVHMEDSINDLNKFQEQLEEHCRNAANKDSYVAGEVVAVHYSGMWYRAEILDIDGKDDISVKLIDYGNVLNLNTTTNPVKELTPDLICHSIFAHRYSLKGKWDDSFTPKFEEIIMQLEDPVRAVILEEGDPSLVKLFRSEEDLAEKLMEEKSKEKVKEDPKLVEEEKGVIVYLTHANSPADFYVQKDSCTSTLNKLTSALSDVENWEDVSVGEEDEIYAAQFPEDNAWYRGKVLKNSSNETEVMFIDYGNTSKVTRLKRLPEDIKNISPLCENYALLNGKNSDVWSRMACKRFRNYSNDYPLEMIVIAKKAKRPIVRLLNEARDISDELDELNERDNREDVYVSHVNSPTDFYIQYVVDPSFKKITEVLEKDTDCQILEDRKPGTLCQARFEVDELWYRAKILQDLGDKCEVFFIDYGNASFATDLKTLPPEIEEIPPRAMKCSLNLLNTNIPESLKDEFIRFTADGTFRGKIITPGDVNIVSLKLNGKLIEELLFLDLVPEMEQPVYDDLGSNENLLANGGVIIENDADLDHSRLPLDEEYGISLDDETDDDKNSKKMGMSEHYLTSYLDDDVIAGSSVLNETDEEKREKMASGVVDGGLDGFRSDDEKGISESGVLSIIVNATDNELIEESQEESLDNEEESSNATQSNEGNDNRTEESSNATQSNEGNDDRTEEDQDSDVSSVENEISEGNPEQEPLSENKTENEETVERSAEEVVNGSQSEGNKDEVSTSEGKGEESTSTVTKEEQSENPSGETSGEVTSSTNEY